MAPPGVSGSRRGAGTRLAGAFHPRLASRGSEPHTTL
jgi:hypothetical protein